MTIKRLLTMMMLKNGFNEKKKLKFEWHACLTRRSCAGLIKFKGYVFFNDEHNVFSYRTTN